MCLGSSRPFSDPQERHHQTARAATVLIAHSVLQRHESIIHVLVGRLEDLSRELAEFKSKSLDFR